MAVVTWLTLGVSIIALLKIDVVQLCIRLWHRRPLFAEDEVQKRLRELEEENEELKRKLVLETAERRREVDELRGELLAVVDGLIKNLRVRLVISFQRWLVLLSSRGCGGLSSLSSGGFSSLSSGGLLFLTAGFCSGKFFHIFFAVSIVALVKTEVKELCIRLRYRQPLSAEGEVQKRMRELEEDYEDLKKELALETAERKREVDELRRQAEIKGL
ncbi:hypothetical protein HDV64DRAFT_280923 [Trichoderma sp. TUCIM 5745]